MAIFVFGSNTGGLHGGGAARFAYDKKGAVWGIGYGMTGEGFAIPSLGCEMVGDSLTIGDKLPLYRIKDYITGFKAFAGDRPDLTFDVTRIGCGIAGFNDSDIAPLFFYSPANCRFDSAWKEIFDEEGYHPEYWGTF